jgi:hypothetical protein
VAFRLSSPADEARIRDWSVISSPRCASINIDWRSRIFAPQPMSIPEQALGKTAQIPKTISGIVTAWAVSSKRAPDCRGAFTGKPKPTHTG